MKITIENKEYKVTDEVTKQLLDFLMQKMYTMYEKTPNTLQMAVTMFVRNELLNLEKKYPDKKDVLRPPKRKDPVEHVLHLAKGVFLEILKEERIYAKTNSNGEINTLEFENSSQSRGSLALSGDFGLRQDHSG